MQRIAKQKLLFLPPVTYDASGDGRSSNSFFLSL